MHRVTEHHGLVGGQGLQQRIVGVDKRLPFAPSSSPTISRSMLTMQELQARAAEADDLRREVSNLRSKFILVEAELSHWRNLCRENGVITERHYQDLRLLK